MKTLPVIGTMKGYVSTEAISLDAKKILSKEALGDKDFSYGETKEEYRATKNSFLCTCSQLKKKLITKEDPIYLHKILGLFALFSFLYRYGYVLPKQGNLGFDGSWFDHFTMFMHLMLSFSSAIFEVLTKRIVNKPLIIWEEYRLHAMVFTAKCVSVYLWGLYG